VTKEVSASRDLHVSFGFKRGGETEFNFTKFNFGIKIYRATGEKECILNYNWPISEALRHKSNKTPYLEEFDYVWDVDASYKIVISGGEEMSQAQHESMFAVPRPAAPYPSWEWDGSQWLAPVGPYSQSSTPPEFQVSGSSKDTFSWDESTGQWKLDIDSPNPRDALSLPDRDKPVGA
jgi:hypothetical protein